MQRQQVLIEAKLKLYEPPGEVAKGIPNPCFEPIRPRSPPPQQLNIYQNSSYIL